MNSMKDLWDSVLKRLSGELSETTINTWFDEVTVVTMEEVAMAMVEMTSPSSELALTPFCSRALMAQGSFRLEMFPVTKLK